MIFQKYPHLIHTCKVVNCILHWLCLTSAYFIVFNYDHDTGNARKLTASILVCITIALFTILMYVCSDIILGKISKSAPSKFNYTTNIIMALSALSGYALSLFTSHVSAIIWLFVPTFVIHFAETVFIVKVYTKQHA